MPRIKGSKNVGGTFVRQKCHWCGKEFWAESELWAYKANLKIAREKSCHEHIFCTWSCLCAAKRNAQRVHEEIIADNRAKREKKKAQEGG